MRNIPIRLIAQKIGLVLEEETFVSGYRIDSRRILPGELFFALKGEKVDGHAFLGSVKEKGGVAAIVSKEYRGSDCGLILLRVESVEESLQSLARSFLEESKTKVIGVTGSVGKTTTKDFIATLLGKKFKTAKSFASYNTKLTLPMTILNLEGNEEALVLEMGMSEPGDIKRLVEIAPPDIAVLTKVALAHTAFFPGGIEEIAKGKAEVFSHPKTRFAVAAYPFFQEFGECGISAEKVSFSLDERSADYFLGFGEGKWMVDEKGIRAYQFDLPFSQPFALHNFLAAVAVARLMKMEWDEINQRVLELKLPEMRFEIFENGGVTFINDAYNANPESMRAALSSLPEPASGGKRIAVLATMKELGSFSEREHLEVGRFAQKYADQLLVLGEEAAGFCEGFQEVKKPAERFLDHKRLSERLKEMMSPGDVVLVKGSRSMQMEKLFEFLLAGGVKR
ncbi:MAG: hypothetical protein A3E80_00215 [Chlamydiae bacterium RIFCSPHIGHO2_12_FULL_49_9]|nr:MAG: hypothetical protein A3E80_00215 [Chlamydiae bacterium RIFCSPHIGHO2_12_FULL_49_9]